MPHLRLAALCIFLAAVSIPAEPLTATIAAPAPTESGYFKLGTAKNPAGHELSVDSRSLRLDGQPWLPVMGEFHYSRCPENEWRDELLKLKAGGISIVATYVFWIHHEEVAGEWDWSGRRDLRKFVQTCRALGLQVVVRCGPWCHGEVRNGGLPDWVQAHKDWKLRSPDTNFLAAVRILYAEIAKQLQGELWKDGGAVIGVQVDNEFYGTPEYLLALKRIAIASGLDVPFYIKTGWPAMKSPVPLGELLPLFGAYADGFWERGLKPMTGGAWEKFTFQIERTDTGIGNDTLGNAKAGDTAGTEKYPHLTCEIGGGMPASYHRRMNYDERDVEAVALTQLGGGSSLMGYYMFHGGVNPDGKLTTLQESQATGYPNDLPEKSYDFNAPLGEYGQLHPQYHWLRRLHLFLTDFGVPLAQMPPTLPDARATNRNDYATLRWCARSDGHAGFVFVNNYQRLQPMPAKTDVQFKLQLPGGEFVFPAQPVTIPADAFFFWPFNLDLGDAKLIYATAQPVCSTEADGTRTIFFAETPGVKAEFVFDAETLVGQASPRAVFSDVNPSHAAAIKLKTKSGAQIQIVLLNEADSLALWKGEFAGRERVILTRAGVVFDNGSLRFATDSPKDLSGEIFPALNATGKDSDGIFSRLPLKPRAGIKQSPAKFTPLREAAAAREIPMSKGKTPVAVAPVESDWTNAAVWRIQVPAAPHALLRIHYTGDIARVTLDGKLLTDNFYNGGAFDIGLDRHAPDIFKGDLRVEILPLRRDAKIFLEKFALPDFGSADSVAKIESVEIINRYEARLDGDSAR